MRYFLHLAYNGSTFHGWQRQPSASSVQQTLEEALSVIVRRPVEIVGAGRTDTGVNAASMYAHLDLDEIPGGKERFLRGLNRLCGRDIAIRDIIPVRDDAHARFDATSRTYKYFVAFRKTPFLYPLSWLSPSQLDTGLMNEAASILLDTDDFTSFAKLHSDAKTNICRVSEAEWKPVQGLASGEGIVFTITADRFLRNMVRAVVGTLVDVGRRKMTILEFQEIIAKRDRCAAGTSMPAQALFLWEVRYPETIFLK